MRTSTEKALDEVRALVAREIDNFAVSGCGEYIRLPLEELMAALTVEP